MSPTSLAEEFQCRTFPAGKANTAQPTTRVVPVPVLSILPGAGVSPPSLPNGHLLDDIMLI